MRRRSSTTLAFLTLLGLVPLLVSKNAKVAIQGKVTIVEGLGAILSSEGIDIRLTSKNEATRATFKDARISGRKMKLFGRFQQDGSFQVDDFFVVRPNSLYCLIYFCDT